MPEIDKMASGASGTGDGDERSPSEGEYFVLDEDRGLDVLEGLAEEDRPADPLASIELAPEFEPQPAPMPSPSEPSLHDGLAALRDDLGRRIDALRSTFERELRGEASRERIVDRLHAELQDYKQDLLLKVQRPIFIDLIQLHDDVGKMVVAGDKAEFDAAGTSSFRRLLESIQTAIEDILYRQGVEPFSLETEEFDPRRQRAISTTPTEDPGLSKTVAARIRKGFASGEKLIRPELVSVFLLRQAPSDQQG
jgi:molecular chaperone GrpE